MMGAYSDLPRTDVRGERGEELALPLSEERNASVFRPPLFWLLAVLLLLTHTAPDWAACCYFAAKRDDVLQPSQKAFITWDPRRKIESFTVQPRFKGSAQDFGMVVPTPSRPSLAEMPRDFFKELAVFTMLMHRENPQSRLMPYGLGAIGGGLGALGGLGSGLGALGGGLGMGGGLPPAKPKKPSLQVLETGVVGSLNYKIISAERADKLFSWLKAHKYQYAGDEATLDFYVKKRWVFTVMKIDTLQMRRNKEGVYVGEVTPTRFQFTSDKLVYPLKITQVSVKDKTEALFYVQAPFKTDLEGDLSYQHRWVPMLESASGIERRPLPREYERWLRVAKDEIPKLRRRGEELGYKFVAGMPAEPNDKGHTPTTLEWARRLKETDIWCLRGQLGYSEIVPDVDAGFTLADVQNPQTAPLVSRVIQLRLDQVKKLRPDGFLVREAPVEDVRGLKLLVGHLKSGMFVTKFRHVFTRDEMNDDLFIVPARLGKAEDVSEYLEVLPSSPP
jgi:hypothetical protein